MNEETRTCPYCSEEIKAEAVKCKWCRSYVGGADRLSSWYRDLPGRTLFGVCSMLGAQTGISTLAWRVIFIVGALVHGLGLWIYAGLWALTPNTPDERTPLEKTILAVKGLFAERRRETVHPSEPA